MMIVSMSHFLLLSCFFKLEREREKERESESESELLFITHSGTIRNSGTTSLEARRKKKERENDYFILFTFNL